MFAERRFNRSSRSRRRTRIATVALVLIAGVAVSGGASTSLASTGSVYFDTGGNVGAGNLLFNGSFTGTTTSASAGR